MQNNQTYLQKADLTVQNLTDEGGALVREQSDEFFEIAILESVLMGLITVHPMGRSEYEIPKIGFTGRVLRGAVEGQALTEAERSRPALDRTILQTKGYKAQVDIPYEAVEENIMLEMFPQYLIGLLATAVGRDMEDLAINSDTALVPTTVEDAVLTLMDGFLKQITSYVVASGGVRLTRTVFETLFKTLPKQYRKQRARMGLLTSGNAAVDYVSSLAARATDRGDDAISMAEAGDWAKIAVIDIPLWPDEQGVGEDQTNVVLTELKNLWVGVQRDVRIESRRDITAGVFQVVVTLRMDAKIQHEQAVAEATEILNDAG
jgi:HK97 family phage major capsid protein